MTAARVTLDLFAWLISLAFNLSLAHLIYRPLRSDRRALNAVLAGFLLIFTTTTVTMISGLLGLLSAGGLAGISLAGLLILVAVPGSRRSLRVLPAELIAATGTVKRSFLALPSWLRWFTLLASALSLVRFAFLIWALPPIVWDSLTYHLTNVAHWVQAGRIELWDTPMVRIYTPANYEVLTSWFVVFLHHDVFIEAAGLPAYALGVLSVFSIGRLVGLRVSASWLGAMAYGATPALLLATTGTKNDPHMAGYYLAALAVTLSLVRDRHRGGTAIVRRWIALFLILLLAAGTKAYVAHMIPGLVVVGLLAAWKEGGKAAAWSMINESWLALHRLSRRAWLGIAVLLALGVFIGGYWNVRNWVITGNPFFPYGVSIEGEKVASGPHNDAELNFDRVVSNLEFIAGKLGDHEFPIVPDLPYTTGWGWFVYVLGIPATLWGLWRSGWFRILSLGFTVSFLLVLMSTRPSPWNMRYIIWFPALFCLGFSFLWDGLDDLTASIRPAFAGLFILTTGLSVLQTVNYGQIDPDEFDYMLSRSVWSRHASSFHQTVPSEYENALVYVPKDATLGYDVHGNGFIYPLYRADFSQRLVYLRLTPDESCSTIAQEMERAGTRYLFVAPEHTPDQDIAKLRECGDAGTEIRERARGLYVLSDS
ncbi:MAG: hypothetical protein WBR18_09495 [Anaerolineales bacterium]